MNEAAVVPEIDEREPRLPGPVFKLVEFQLYHYREYKSVIRSLPDYREDMHNRGRQWEPGAAPGTMQESQIERKTVLILLMEEKARKAAIWVQGIEDVLAVLTAEDRRLVELKYFEGYLSNAGVARELRMSEATYYRRRDQVIRKFAIRFGLA